MTSTLKRFADFCAAESSDFEPWFFENLDEVERYFSNPDDFLALLELDLVTDVSRAHGLLAAVLREHSYQAPLSAEAVRSAEVHLGHKLPDSYILYAGSTEYVGGSVAVGAISIDPTLRYYLGDGEWEVEEVWKMEPWENQCSILKSPDISAEWDLPDGLVILCGDGHTWNALDYRKGVGDPPVVFVESDGGQIFRLATNFSEFLRALKHGLS